MYDIQVRARANRILNCFCLLLIFSPTATDIESNKSNVPTLEKLLIKSMRHNSELNGQGEQKQTKDWTIMAIQSYIRFHAIT